MSKMDANEQNEIMWKKYNIVKIMNALSSMTDKLKEELAHQEMQKWWIIQNINWYLQLRVHIKFQNQFAHGKV